MNSKRKASLLVVLIFVCFVTVVFSIGIGSVKIPPADVISVILKNIFGIDVGRVDEITQSLVWSIRIPRTLLAFVSGGGLALSGVMMQSVLRNPLASSFTLGVSSGASLGASIAILLKITIFGLLTLPIFGFSFGILTVFLALGVAANIDPNLQNNSIILTGMAFSLFANSMVTIIMSLARKEMQQLIFWQMGSFAMKMPQNIYILAPVLILGSLVAFCFARQMDIMTFGEEQAKISGLDANKTKWVLLCLSATITGMVVSIVGLIGFVDLFTPHIARKVFGASHRYVLPASVMIGGSFMVLCDIVARSVAAPIELPVGAITAAIGAPFFIYLYFSRKKGEL